MSKTLKGTYLWNEVINPPSQEFNIVFTQEVKTNYGISGITNFKAYKQDPAFMTYGFQNGETRGVYNETYHSGWVHNGYRTITFGNANSEETVPDEFYTWFAANAVLLSSENTVEITGTWRWDDTVLGPAGAQDWMEEEQNYVYNYDALPVSGLVFYENINASVATSGLKIQAIQVIASQQGQTTSSGRPTPTYHIDMLYVGTDIGGTGVDSFKSYEGYTNKQGINDYLGIWYGKGNKTITFNPGTTVSATFYSWLMTNAQSVELCELNGRWKWNDIPAHHTRDFDVVKIDFNSGFTDMKYMLIDPDDQGSSSDLTYISPKFSHKAYGDTVDLNRVWVEQSYRIVDFGYTGQLVTREFYDWFTANATIQTLVEISGVWSFDENVTYAPEYWNGCEPVSFKTYVNGRTYLGMSMDDGKDDIGFYSNLYYCTYIEHSELVEYNQVYREDSMGDHWTHELTNRTIDFGDTPQLVSSEFYDWFTENTVEASYEISGVWVFKKELSEFTGKPTTISGTRWFINIAERSNLSIDPHGLNDKFTIKYDDLLVFYDGKWENDYYRVIRIVGSIRVSESFYSWFMDNVERQHFLIEKSTLTEIGNAIRAKTGNNKEIKVSELAKEVSNIPTTSGNIVSVSIREIK